MNRLILVVDFGTSNVHVNVVDVENGNIPVSTSRKYQIICPQSGYIELDPEEMWKKSEEGVEEVVSEVTKINEKNGISYRIEALSFSYFGDNIIPVDENGEANYHLLQCFDERGKKQAARLNELLGEDVLIKKTGDASEFTSCSSKIKYILEEMKDVSENTKKFYNIQQYVLNKLGLPDVNDITMACTKRMVDLENQTWYGPLVEAVGIQKEQLGEIVLSTEVIGEIQTYGNVEFPNRIKVVPGAHDCDCGWLGVGISDEKEAVIGNITGTFEHFGYLANGCQNMYADHPEWELFSYRGPLEDTSVVLTAFDTSGALLEWFMRELNGDTSGAAYKKFWETVKFDGQNPVKVRPDFSSGQGKIEGLTLGNTKVEIFKAIIESLTFESRIMVELCEQAKQGDVQTVRMGGGHAKSPEWVQLRADVTGKTYECMEQLEVSSVGAAILAAVGVGIYKDAAEAIRNMVQIRRVYHPNLEVHQMYEDVYQEYLDRYQKRRLSV